MNKKTNKKMNRKLCKRIISAVMVAATLFSFCATCYADDYDITSQTGSMKTTVKLSETEGFKVTIPAEITLSYATGKADTTIEFRDVLLSAGHTLTFDLYDQTSDYDMEEEMLILENENSKKLYIDVYLDDSQTPYDGSESTLFTISSSVASVDHKVSFSINKDYTSGSDNNYPVTGTNYSGKMVYCINIG